MNPVGVQNQQTRSTPIRIDIVGGSAHLRGPEVVRVRADRLRPREQGLERELDAKRAEIEQLLVEHGRIAARIREAESEARKLALALAKPRLACPYGCECRVRLAESEEPLPELEYAELVAWMEVLIPSSDGGLFWNRRAHDERRTKPESPLNAAHVGLARGLAASGVTPAHYARLHGAAQSRSPKDVIRLLGGAAAAASLGLRLDSSGRIEWLRFCPIVWAEAEASERLLADSLSESAELIGREP